MSKTIDVSIIIVNYNTWHLLEPCIKTIEAYCNDVSYEIIVVDNASSDGSVQKIEQVFPEVILLINKDNAGFGVANNQGAAMATGKFLFLLNSDTLLVESGLGAAIDYMRDNDISMLGPKLLNEDGSLQPSSQKVNTLGHQLKNILSMVFRVDRLMGRAAPSSQTLEEVGFLLGAAMLLDSSVVREIGLFDEQFYFTGEERDLCLRFMKAGKKIIFFPEWSVIHLGGGGVSHSPFHIINWVKSTIKLMRKHGGIQYVIAAKVLFLLLLSSNALSCFIKLKVKRDEAQRIYASVYYHCLLWYLGLMDENVAMGKA